MTMTVSELEVLVSEINLACEHCAEHPAQWILHSISCNHSPCLICAACKGEVDSWPLVICNTHDAPILIRWEKL